MEASYTSEILLIDIITLKLPLITWNYPYHSKGRIGSVLKYNVLASAGQQLRQHCFSKVLNLNIDLKLVNLQQTFQFNMTWTQCNVCGLQHSPKNISSQDYSINGAVMHYGKLFKQCQYLRVKKRGGTSEGSIVLQVTNSLGSPEFSSISRPTNPSQALNLVA